MKKNKKRRTENAQLPVEDEGTLGYGQGLEYGSFHYTQPIKIPEEWREERRRKLAAARERRQQAQTQEASVSKAGSIGRATIILTVTLIASRCLGLLRSSLFLGIIGVNLYSDAFNLAFKLPDLVFNIIAGGALSSAFIPVFKLYWGQNKHKTAWHIANTAINVATAALILLALLGILFAEPLLRLWSLPLSNEQLQLTVTLMRIMFLQSVIMGTGVIITSILQAHEQFLLPALGNVLYPLGIIIGLLPGFLLNVTHHRNDYLAVLCATWGVVLGALLMVLVQLPGLHKVGMHYRLSFDWKHPGIRQIGRQMIPRFVNTLMLQLATWVDLFFLTFLAATTVSGVISMSQQALAITTIPLSLVAPLAVASFPRMAEYAAQRNLTRLKALVMEALESVIFITIPVAVGMAFLSLPIVQLLYEHGRMTLDQAYIMSIPLFCFTLGIPGMALVEVLVRPFYALRMNKIAVFISACQFILKICLSILLIYPFVWFVQTGIITSELPSVEKLPLEGAWGMGALALATSIAGLIEACALLWVLHIQLRGFQMRVFTGFVARVLLATLALALTIGVTKWLLDTFIPTTNHAGNSTLSLVGMLFVILKLAIIAGVGTFVYLRSARFLHLLGGGQLQPVNRLLIKLKLAWI